MKIQNVGLDNAYAIVRGWVSQFAAAASGLISVSDETTGTSVGPVNSMVLVGQLLNDGGSGKVFVDVQAVLTEYTNSGVDLVAGDVVVIDSSADLAVTTTTTAQDTRPVGIVLGPIGAGGTGPVQTAGIIQSINVTASVTRGEYAETSTTAKQATQNAARRAGSFGIYLESGTTPAVLLFGITDGSNSAATSVGGNDVTPPQSTAVPAWVKPTGSGVITEDPQGRITVVDTSTYKAFPGMTFLEGRLHLVYRDASAHNAAGGVIKYATSDDLGRTWSSPATIYSPAATMDLRDPTITALSSGRLLLAWHTASTGGTIAVVVQTGYSDNRGQSWSSVYTVPNGFSGQVAGSSPALELPNGNILLGGYGESGGNYSSVVWKSTDGGLTFPTQITVASSGSRDYDEPQFRLLASGKIVGLLRTSGTNHTYRTVSTDQGATWSAPADVLTAGAGRPDFVEFYPGALLLSIRLSSASDLARWAVSWDEGATWTALQETDAGETATLMYSSLVALTPGYVVMVYCLQNSASDADVYLRYFYDGFGTDPLGNVRAKVGGTLVTPTDGTVGQVLTTNGVGTSTWADTAPVISGHYEVLMTSGISSPPDPLISTGGTDWLWGLFP